MRKQIIPKRLAAGLLSLVMLLTLLPAMSIPAAAATDDFFTVSGKVNGMESTYRKNFTATLNSMGEAVVATIPTMHTGKKQEVTIKANKAATWTMPLGELPSGMEPTISGDGETWKLAGTVSDSQHGQGRFLLNATTVDGESHSIWVYYYCCADEDRPKIETTSLPDGAVGERYHADLAYSGTTDGVVTWEVVEKEGQGLPPGVELYTSTGTRWLDGTPTEEGTYTFTLEVTTIAGTSDEKEFTITIDKAWQDAVLQTGKKLHAKIGETYTADAPLFDMNDLIDSGTDAYPALKRNGWSNATNLPDGLKLNTDGTITGMIEDGTTAPTGTHYFHATVTNDVRSYQGSAEIYVYRTPTIEANMADTNTFTDSDGTITATFSAGEYFIWQPLTGTETAARYEIVADGSDVTAETLESEYGLIFNDMTGSIWGTAKKDTAALDGSALTLAVRRYAIDNYSTRIDGAESDTKTLKLTIQQDRRFIVSETGTYYFPSVTVSGEEDYTPPAAKTFTVTGTGYSDVDVSVALSGTENFTLGVPADSTLTLNEDGTLTLSGLKTGSDAQSFTVQPKAGLEANTYTATVTVSDTNSDGDAETKTFTVSFQVSDRHVNPQVTNGGELPYAVAGQTYTYQFNASGTPSYQWQIKAEDDSGSLPEDMTINESGLLTWYVPEGQRGQVSFDVAADPNVEKTNGWKYAYITVYQPVKIKLETTSMTSATTAYVPYTGTAVTGENDRVLIPDGYVDQSYAYHYDGYSHGSYRLNVSTDSTADRVFVEGALPDGMKAEPNSGTSNSWLGLSGTPTRAGTYDFTIVAQKYHTDGTLVSEARQKVRLIIYEAFTVKYNSFGDLGEVGKPVSLDLSRFVSGGKKEADGTYHYSLRTGESLPAGLSLSEDGIISGTPTMWSMGCNCSIEVQDANGVTRSSGYNFGWIYVPLPELTVPDTGATFINQLSVDLSEDYKAQFSTGTYELGCTYEVLNTAGNPRWGRIDSQMFAEGTAITLTTEEINAALAGASPSQSTLAVNEKVALKVELRWNNGSSGTMPGSSRTVTFTKVETPAAPTASPGTANGTYTFSGAAEYVQLATSTNDCGVIYTTGTSTSLPNDPTLTVNSTTGEGTPASGTTIYTGIPVAVADGTVIKARSYRISGDRIDYSNVATFTYEKAPGVTVSGTAVSWNSTNDAQYYLYPATAEDATIRAQWKTGGKVEGYKSEYTATKGAISAATVDGKNMHSQSFSFTAVAAGEYKLVIFKPGKYVPKIVPIIVSASDYTCGQQKLWLYGDVTGDGEITVADGMAVYRKAAGKTSAFDLTSDPDVKFAADINYDEDITVADGMAIYRKAAGKTSAFDLIK